MSIFLDTFCNLSDHTDSTIHTYGFIENLKHQKSVSFLVLRNGLQTIQCVGNVDGNITVESFVRMEGWVRKVKRAVKACTVKEFEIEIVGIEVVSKAEKLPFELKDINTGRFITQSSKSENNNIARQSEGIKSEIVVQMKTRLDNRCIDLRGRQSGSIMRMLSEVMFSFRSFLRDADFIEMKTSKLVGSGTEGGANLFEVKYFNRKAYLAQSPQLYKQMMIVGGMKRVYEISHVYRQEESNINRYLSEFTGVDVEMESHDYLDTIHFVYKMFCSVFECMKKKKIEYEILREFFGFEDLRFGEEPLILTHRECVDILKKEGFEIEYSEDFSRGNEKKLGDIISRDKKIDFFIIKDYPKGCRAFYTKAKEDDPFYSMSYDGILRGEEIFSGAMRISDYEELKQSAIDSGIDPAGLQGYLECFKFGVPRHAGCGIGLERFMKAFFGSNDIRLFSSFPRDPTRITP